MRMTDFALQVVIIALLACYFVTLAKKWGVVEYMQVHGNDFIYKLANCDFCLSWWAGVIIAVTWWIATGDTFVLLAPFCSTIITRNML